MLGLGEVVNLQLEFSNFDNLFEMASHAWAASMNRDNHERLERNLNIGAESLRGKKQFFQQRSAPDLGL